MHTGAARRKLKRAELEEVEDLLEYYLQRATTTQSEAERLLAGSRDLEESIGVSLSARRFEVRSKALTTGTSLSLPTIPCIPAFETRWSVVHDSSCDSTHTKVDANAAQITMFTVAADADAAAYLQVCM